MNTLQNNQDTFLNNKLYDQTYTTEQIELVKQIINDKTKKFIVFDGIIGAGKTTLINLLNNYYTNKGLKTHPIYEPVDIWQSSGALQYFYDNIPAHCYEFQTFTFITRIKRIVDELLKFPNYDIYLLERSIWSDKYIFAALLENEFGTTRINMYNQWWSLWSMIVPIKPHKWVLLNTSIDESFKRINGRNRNEEQTGVSTNYQTKLAQKHCEFYEMLKKDTNIKNDIIIINNTLMDDNFITNQNTLAKIAQIIY